MKYDLEFDYIEGLKLITENKNIILEYECKEDYNNKAKLFFDKRQSALQESKFVENNNSQWEHVENGHVFDPSIEKLTLDSCYLENAAILINKIFNYPLKIKNWNDIYEFVKGGNKNVLAYLISIYYCTDIRDAEGIEECKIYEIKEIIESKIYD